MTIMHMPLAPTIPVAPAGLASSPASVAALERRLIRVSEAAGLIGRYSPSTLNRLICQRELPVVIMPSAVTHRDPLRRVFRVPIVWIPRWLEMADKDHPVYTARAEVRGGPGEPLYCTVGASAAACSVSERQVRDLVRLGRWAPVIRPGGGEPTIRVAALDGWIFDMVHAAEVAWYGGESGR